MFFGGAHSSVSGRHRIPERRPASSAIGSSLNCVVGSGWEKEKLGSGARGTLGAEEAQEHAAPAEISSVAVGDFCRGVAPFEVALFEVALFGSQHWQSLGVQQHSHVLSDPLPPWRPLPPWKDAPHASPASALDPKVRGATAVARSQPIKIVNERIRLIHPDYHKEIGTREAE